MRAAIESQQLVDRQPDLCADVRVAVNEALALVTMIVLALVDNPAQVKVHAETSGPEKSVIHVVSSPLDTGKLVGKQGRTVRAMRTILSGHSMRVRHRFEINIVETGRVNADRD
jgi:predicted RNA-binding protein YlqC (UPF0109 family)